jgi:hypothetical protein
MSTLTFDKNDIIKEHERLTKLLKKISEQLKIINDQLKKEYEEQNNELREYKEKKGKGYKEDKIHKVMHEFKEGKLKTSHGKTVTNPKQAVAIAFSEMNAQKLL